MIGEKSIREYLIIKIGNEYLVSYVSRGLFWCGVCLTWIEEVYGKGIRINDVCYVKIGECFILYLLV